jgi:hypothetical protein
LNNLKDANSRGQRLRWLRVKNEAIREQNNDYYKIRAMLPANFPGKDDVVSAIFEDLLTGRLQPENVRARVPDYVAAHNSDVSADYIAGFTGAELDGIGDATSLPSRHDQI